MLKNQKVRLSLLALLTIFAIGIFCIVRKYDYAFCKDTESAAKSFLESHHESIDVENNLDFKGFELLKSELENHDVVLCGESHQFAVNSKLELKFIKYLNKTAGIRYVLAEMGYSQSALLNRYLDSGDEKDLQDYFWDLKGTAAYTKEYYNLWQNLCLYNKSLPKDKKIKIYGIDVEHQIGTALYYLESILPDGKVPSSIKEVIFKLRDSNGQITSYKSLENFIMLYETSVKKHSEVYQNYFKDKFFDFQMVLENIKNRIVFYKDMSKMQIRDNNMYENFVKIYKHLGGGKFYGEFGGEHIMQNRLSKDFKPFSMLLGGKESPVKNRVISISYNYDNDELLKNYCTSTITLFKLTGFLSPFAKSRTFVEELGEDSGKTTEYFQYIVNCKDKSIITPLN